MSGSKRCPDCKYVVNRKDGKCGCGWKGEKAENKYVTNQISSHRCMYIALGRQCPLDGTNAANLYGTGYWLCVEHGLNLGNAKRCEEILIEAERNFESIMESRIDWRKKLIPEEYEIRKTQIGKLALEIRKLKGDF